MVVRNPITALHDSACEFIVHEGYGFGNMDYHRHLNDSKPPRHDWFRVLPETMRVCQIFWIQT